MTKRHLLLMEPVWHVKFEKLRPIWKRLGSIITSIWHPLITGPVMCTTLSTQRNIDTIWTPELEAEGTLNCGNGTGWSSCEEWCLSTVSYKKISWWSADGQLMSCWQVADEWLMVSSFLEGDERVISSWYTADEGLMSCWMTNWWSADEWLISSWWAADEQLMSS